MKLLVCLFALFMAGCVLSPSYIPETQELDRSRLSIPDVTVSIQNLGPCTDSNEKSIQFDSNAPITVLVHGCKGSAGRFRALAQLYAFHGQQAICYSYDDRDSLVDGATKLSKSLNELSKVTKNQNISVLGHSMGGLISRKALEKGRNILEGKNNKNFELITVSAPFSGIEIARHCGTKPLHWLSLGIVPGICWLVTGDNWYEITSSSSFIRQPKPLIPAVQKYLKVVTNEEDTCRRKSSDGKCTDSDFVFTLSEQYQPVIDSYPNVIGVQVDAGHVEIVGDKRVAPRKLLSILQEYEIISSTPLHREAALKRLIASLY